MPSTAPGFPENFPGGDILSRNWRYRTTATIFRTAYRLWLAGGLLSIEGLENASIEGPLIIASNHLSSIDPPLFGFLPGPIFTMGKQELFRNRLTTWLLLSANTFPVDRLGADRQALRIALDILNRKGRLLLFPEGGVSGETGMQRVKPGAGFLLKRSRATVLPCAITGTEAVWPTNSHRPHRAPVTLRIGQPVLGLGDYSGNNEELADRIGKEIAALLPKRYRGFYSNTTDG